MTKYNLDYLEKRLGPFQKEFKYPSKPISGLNFVYVETETKKQLDESVNQIKEEMNPGYIWGYVNETDAIYVTRAFGENKIFIYNPTSIKKTEYVKGKLKVIKNLTEDTINELFDQKAVFDYFYRKLWDLRLKLGKEIRDKNNISDNKALMGAQYIIDRVIFTYFICEKGLVTLNGTNVLDSRTLFNSISKMPDPWRCIKNLFFEQFAKKESEPLLLGKNAQIITPYLNGGLFRAKTIEGISEQNLKIEYSKDQWQELFEPLNKYTWIIEDEIPDHKGEYEGNLTPEIIGHIYEKFVITMETLDEIKLDELKISKSGDLKKGNKKIGAYYTPEYITDYICRNTITLNLYKKLALNEGMDFQIFVTKSNPEILEDALEFLDDMSICDPACGSGAFLIKAGEILLEYKIQIIKKLNNEINRYQLKKNIIINNLYGVDIQEGAIEICKLRLWLWLISSSRNQKVEPLPNIEYNFVMGNSLVGWVDEKLNQNILIQIDKRDIRPLISLKTGFASNQKLIIDSAIDFLNETNVKSYAKAFSLLKSLYSYSEGENAEILKETIEWIREAIYDKVNGVFYDYVSSEVNKITIHDFKRFKPLHWIVDFNEIFENGGFDIVIGNPPYLSFQIRGKEEKEYLKNMYKTPYRNYDIYVVFTEKGINLIKNSGEFGYIIPNKFINSQYGKNLKEFLNDFFIREIIDFDDTQIFDSVKNYTCILIVEKENKISETSYLENIENPEKALSEFLDKRSKGKMYTLQEIKSENIKRWELIDKKESEIFNKLTKFSTLQDLSKNIYEGARPGYEKAYIVNRKEINKLNLEKDIIRPFIKSEDVDDFIIDCKGITDNPKFLIFPYKEKNDGFELLNIDKYPQIRNFLEKSRSDLYDNAGKDDSKLRYKFYHLPKELRGNVKLLTPDISKKNEFALSDDSDLIFPNTIYAIDLHKQYESFKYEILGLLNSKLLEFFLKKKSPSVRGGYFRYKSEYLEKFPIVELEEIPLSFKDNVKDICSRKEAEADERRSFVLWLQREWQTDVEKLSKKSYIKTYWNYDFNDKNSILRVAKNNKDKIKEDTSSQEFEQKLRKKWKASVEKLKILKEEIQDLMNQNDAITFKVYDLTENEAEIILKSLETEETDERDIMEKFYTVKL